MRYLYNIVAWIANIGELLLAPYYRKAGLRRRGLAGQSHLVSSQPSSATKRILIHAASHGEYEQAKPLIHKINETFPSLDIALSFFSPSGYEVARDEHGDTEDIYYLPIDTGSNMKRFLNMTSPAVIVLMKYELWPNLIEEATRREIPIVLVSARFPERHAVFGIAGSLLRQTLGRLSQIYVQDQASEDRLAAYGIDATVTGDTRADQVLERASISHPELEWVRQWYPDRPLLVLGSLWPQGWQVLKTSFEDLLQHYRVIIAPHEISESFISDLHHDIDQPVVRWTQLVSNVIPDERIIIMDTIGVLADIYRYADVAYVGGAFKQGLHNVLEPAGYGIPVIFGPNIQAYDEALALIQAGAAQSISDPTTWRKIWTSFLDETTRQQSGAAALDYVRQCAGASERTFSGLRPLLEKVACSPS